MTRSLMYRRHSERSERYPHDDLPPHLKKIILQAIRYAWERTLQDLHSEGKPLPNNENDLTALLWDSLNELRRDNTILAPFSSAIFQSIARDACAVSFDGSQLHKRPDLAFRLVGSSDDYDAWFTECKVLDSSRNIGRYLQQGIDRFINGEYAWTMPSALMLAYTNGSYSCGDSLVNGCERHSYQLPELDSEFSWEETEVWKSKHDRAWCYPGTSRSPGEIDLLHLWLSA